MKEIKQTIFLKDRPYDSRFKVSERYGVAPWTISRWELSGKIPRGIKIGRTFYYDRADVESAIMGEERILHDGQ